MLQGEQIPHEEKVFSIFEPHTEWISKGKAGVPLELGMRVSVVEDQHRFLLHHRVMEKVSDERVAVAVIEETKASFKQLESISMDKGFHSAADQTRLKQLVRLAVLPKKGRVSQADREREYDPEFVELRHRHSAVESGINALEVHGLDRCPDHGFEGFRHCVAPAVLARNIHRLGAVLREQKRLKE